MSGLLHGEMQARKSIIWNQIYLLSRTLARSLLLQKLQGGYKIRKYGAKKKQAAEGWCHQVRGRRNGNEERSGRKGIAGVQMGTSGRKSSILRRDSGQGASKKKRIPERAMLELC